ncbi:F0F1 ATP synthase subunit delta [Arenibacter certesii]|uniref:ATP synthase subunit b n=1 Tax=Arenibacter certesii TaxID=228955 RepID=A0A918J0D4_9FLAO|nr:F0F1 ATP synthase subunit delta [Arenibacter certesii]GGW41191.1 hypothetical protein GCM10007383_27440 [Arenibacter certesii]
MNINWFTVIAQIINFLVLVWLLKRFLYKPVLTAIDERDKKIASQLENAAAKKAEAEKEYDKFLQKNDIFDKERAAQMNSVYEEADLEKQRLYHGIREEATALRKKYEASLKQREKDLTVKLKRRTKEEVFAITEKTLADLADTKLDQQVVKVFINKIENLDKDNLSKLKNAFNNNEIINVTSAFELSPISKSVLQKTLKDITGLETDFQYSIDPELISGVEINTKSYQLSWNIEAYLEVLKNNSITKDNDNESA